jgi:hypothetical protein
MAMQSLLPRALALAALISLAGASPAAGSACSGTNFDEVWLQPGCSTICYEEPCRAHLRLPKGKGRLTVLDGGVLIGHYPAGQTVDLGHFWRGNHRLEVEGAGVPPTYLFVGGHSVE